MIAVRFRAFSFLREKLKAQNLGYHDVRMELEDGSSVEALISSVGLEPTDVEAAFVNERTQPVSTVLQDGDRVALVPPGMPGPHRVLMGVYGGKATGQTDS